MPRPKSLQPFYRFHVSGQARVTLDGRDYFLGKHGTPESWAKYHALLAKYVANGLTMPEVERLADEAIQIRHVTADYRARELPRYQHNDGAYTSLEALSRFID
jgi:hypothetical protein